MTAGGSFTQRVDTCTSASAFVEVAGQDLAKGLTVGAIAASAATIVSQTATSIANTVVLEDQRPAFNGLAEDEFLVNSFTTAKTTLTTATISTNMPNELVLMFFNIQKGATTVSSVTTAGLTWVNVGRANTNAGSVELWRTFVATPQIYTMTVNFSASTVSGNFMVVGLVGADMTGTNGSGAVGAFNTGSSTNAAPTITVTTTRNNSWVWGAGNDPVATTTATAGSNQTILRTTSDATNTCRSWMQRQNALTSSAGSNVTINATAPSADSCNILAVEILPAVYHSLGATGAGG
jgi:hypothetical protein